MHSINKFAEVALRQKITRFKIWRTRWSSCRRQLITLSKIKCRRKCCTQKEGGAPSFSRELNQCRCAIESACKNFFDHDFVLSGLQGAYNWAIIRSLFEKEMSKNACACKSASDYTRRYEGFPCPICYSYGCQLLYLNRNMFFFL